MRPLALPSCTVLLIAAAGCLAGAQERVVRRQGGATVPPEFLSPPGLTELYEERVELTMNQYGGRPLISAELNGHGPYRFILDTGSSLSAILDRKVVAEAGIETGEAVPVPGLPGHAAIVDSLLFEGMEMSEVHAVASDVAALFRGAEDAPKGILGIGLFADCLLTLDFPAKRYVLREGTLEKPGTGGVIPYQAQGKVGFEVELVGVSVTVHMDTGSPGALLLPNSYADKVPLDGPLADAGHIRTPMGGAPVRQATLAGVLNVAGEHFERPTIRFADLPQLKASNEGNIGMELLGKFAITFDQKSHRLHFQRGPTRSR